ncbi:TetR family transcriptional regulator [Dictyobacter vulcani]|uniref:TetR family transcriptional regulator n=1 Tax=Dictyobacter vulcani TaxID=2607529 RepID=A0A5J4KXE3_9CHLR|nr:TetR/AcrR family transcriptional regulator [Dictyobacter vulcani]GER92173.1 TetR family transcriptional regulator [Dictyobacter vulcani]
MSPRAGLDRTSITDAALQLVDTEGIEALSLGKLARRLGVRTPSLYNHVDGLSGLKHDLAAYCLREVLERTARSTIGKAGADAIVAFANAYLSYARETPARYTLTLAPDPDNQEVQKLATQLVEIVQAILAHYHLDYQDEIHAIRSLRSLIHGFISLQQASGFRMAVDPQASFNWMLNLFISGLEKT